MPKADTIHIPSRRALLAGLPLAAVAVGASVAMTASAGADDPMLRLCAEFDDLTRARLASFDAIKDDDERDLFLEQIQARQDGVKAAMRSLPPVTMAGCKALVSSICLDSPDAKDDPEEIATGQIDGDLVCLLLQALAT